MSHPYRLELHSHPRDELAEVVIKRRLSAPNAGDPTPLTPFQLARRLRGLISRGAHALHVPRVFAASVDPSFRLQIIPLVVYPTIDVPPLKVALPKASNTTDCKVLSAASLAACGVTWRCGDKCRLAFRDYFGKCLSPTVVIAEHDRIYQQYHEFFHDCRVCTEQRRTRIKRQCRVHSVTSGYPAMCSTNCAAEFMPYYSDCLSYQTEKVSEADRLNIENFYAQCSRCTNARQKNVMEVCDPRVGPRSPYPATCTRPCSALFNTFYDQCLASNVGGPSAQQLEFRENCRVAADGGISLRIKVRKDISSIEDKLQWNNLFVTTVSMLLNCDRTR